MSEMTECTKPHLKELGFENITREHSHVLAALHKTSYGKPWSASEFEQIVDHSNAGGLIALNEELVPVGFVLARFVIDEAEILTICVDPKFRGQKIGTRIFKSIVAIFKTQGVSKIHLEVAENNLPAIKLYQRCGFSSVGERPGYYRKHGQKAENATIMVSTI